VRPFARFLPNFLMYGKCFWKCLKGYFLGTCKKSCWIWARPHSSERGTSLGETFLIEPESNLYTETNICVHCKKRLAIFPSPCQSGCHYNHSLAGISDIPAEDGKMLIFFYSVVVGAWYSKRYCYITVDSEMAASQNLIYTLSLHKKTNIFQNMTTLHLLYDTFLELCKTPFCDTAASKSTVM
jgi:hypothetical protein